MKPGEWYRNDSKGGKSISLMKLIEEIGDKWAVELYHNGYCCCPPSSAGKFKLTSRLVVHLNNPSGMISEEEAMQMLEVSEEVK